MRFSFIYRLKIFNLRENDSGVKVFTTKLDTLSLISGLHMVEGEKRGTTKLSSDFHMFTATYMQGQHVHTQIKT